MCLRINRSAERLRWETMSTRPSWLSSRKRKVSPLYTIIILILYLKPCTLRNDLRSCYCLPKRSSARRKIRARTVVCLSKRNRKWINWIIVSPHNNIFSLLVVKVAHAYFFWFFTKKEKCLFLHNNKSINNSWRAVVYNVVLCYYNNNIILLLL